MNPNIRKNMIGSPFNYGTNSKAPLRVLLVLLVLLGLPNASKAQIGTQRVTLDAGWNAVWLEVEPIYPAGHANEGKVKLPEDVFTNAAIDIITTPKQLAGLAEFFGDAPFDADNIDPDPAFPVSQYNQGGWETWLRADPPDVGRLVTTFGNRPYLIHVDAGTAQFALDIEGKARFFRPTWTPDRYSLIGFGTDGVISFEDFFKPVTATHPLGKIYALNADGSWTVVTAGDPVKNDTAYWIYCNGISDYMGPVAVDFDLAALGQLSFGGPGDAFTVDEAPDDLVLDLEEIVLTNLNATGDPAVPELDLIAADPLDEPQGNPASGLFLHIVKPVTDNLGYERFGGMVDTTENLLTAPSTPAPIGESIEAQTTGVLTVGARRVWSTGRTERTNLYRLRTGGGNEVWLPVSALHNDLQLPGATVPATADADVAGLWAGEVIIDTVTSLVEDGGPTRPAAGSAPILILLHSDDIGTVSLLSQVTVMQTKSADPEVVPEPVLVLDPARIPYFEGVKERNGKRVGVRLEAVAYDMPRKLDIITQAALVAKAAAQVPPVTLEDDSDVLDYLLARKLRPPDLDEVYKLSLELAGELGAAKSVSTKSTDPLKLDPFHRSNPFRHAFHQQHARGVSITRQIEIVFDSEQPINGRLAGTFSEILQGLTKSNLQLTGRVSLQRVSAVDQLEGAE
jgi:hypothetical protein